MLDIHFDGDYLTIGRDGKQMASLTKYELSQANNINGRQISNWITHYSEKDWVTNDFLYRLGKVLKDNTESDIDWEATFYIIEKEDYNTESFKLKRELEEGRGEKDFTASDTARMLIHSLSDYSEELKRQ